MAIGSFFLIRLTLKASQGVIVNYYGLPPIIRSYALLVYCFVIVGIIPASLEFKLTFLFLPPDIRFNQDYYLADSIVDKTEGISLLENEIILFLDKEKTSSSTRHESTNVYVKLILEDIRRTAEHASDIAEGAMNETVSEVIEKIQSVS